MDPNNTEGQDEYDPTQYNWDMAHPDYMPGVSPFQNSDHPTGLDTTQSDGIQNRQYTFYANTAYTNPGFNSPVDAHSHQKQQDYNQLPNFPVPEILDVAMPGHIVNPIVTDDLRSPCPIPQNHPWYCSLCNNGFSSKRSVHRHLWAKHPKEAAENQIPSELTKCPQCEHISRKDLLPRHLISKHQPAAPSSST